MDEKIKYNMSDEFFWHLVRHQKEWSEQYAEQERNAKDEYNKKWRTYQEKLRREKGIKPRKTNLYDF